MEDPYKVDLTVQGMVLVLILSMPAIVFANLSDLLVSLIHVLTQIQEQTTRICNKVNSRCLNVGAYYRFYGRRAIFFEKFRFIVYVIGDLICLLFLELILQ